MHILLAGLNHRTAPLDIRDKVAYSKDQLGGALAQLTELFGEAVLVSTCNRTEIYTAAAAPQEASQRIIDFLASTHGLSVGDLADHVYHRHGSDAVSHLFRVSSGLDSMIIGESQILGQVRDALTAASESQSVKVPMVGLFHGAIRTGRRVREETAISRNALSISYAGVRLAERLMGGLKSQRVLLIGAGEAGALVASALRTSGVASLTVTNRTLRRAEDLADELGALAAPLQSLEDMLPHADIVIAATDAPEHVITLEMAAKSLAEREFRPQFYFDLAVPRDISPSLKTLPELNLYDIDDLSEIAEENLEDRKRAAVTAEKIVARETEAFMRWWESLDAVPIIRSIRRQADTIRQRELERAYRMLPELTDEQARVIDAMSAAIVNKLLHDPTVSLKQTSDKTQLQSARDLFGLWDENIPGV